MPENMAGVQSMKPTPASACTQEGWTTGRSILVLACLLFLLLGSGRTEVAAAGTTAGHEPSCQQSDMCSINKTKHFWGSVKSSAGLKHMLANVAYKRELIMVVNGGVSHMEFLLLLRNQLMRLGFAHLLVLATSSEGCDLLKQYGEHSITAWSCAWDESEMHPKSWPGHPQLLWHMRWRVLTRVARLGYNVLSIDSDVQVFQDPYIHFKSPPLDTLHLIAVYEEWDSLGCSLNGGFVYVQNARADGPTTWLFHWTTEVPLRWMDNNLETNRLWGRDPDHMCVHDDQCFIQDGLFSAMAGELLYPCTLSSCAPHGQQWLAAGVGGSNKEQAMDLVRQKSKCSNFATVMVHPPTWPKLPVLGPTLTTMRPGRMTVPNMSNLNNASLGGPIYSDVGGQYTSAYFKQLREDCPDCPSWRPSPLRNVSGTEMIGLAPLWLAAATWKLNHGMLTPADGTVPRQVFAHGNYLPLASSFHWKMLVSKVYGGFDWGVSLRLHSKLSEQHDRAYTPGPYFSGKAPQRVIALSPTLVDLTRTRSRKEYKQVVAGLYQLALMSNRAIVIPDIPCMAKWAHLLNNDTSMCTNYSKVFSGDSWDSSRLNAHDLPYLSHLNLSQVSFGVGASLFHITAAHFASPQCLGAGVYEEKSSLLRGIMEVELGHWLQHDAPGAPLSYEASERNTLLWSDRRGCAPPSTGEIFLMDEMEVLSEQEVLQELNIFDSEPLLFVGHPLTVSIHDRGVYMGDDMMKGASAWKISFHHMLAECRGMYRDETMPDKLAAAYNASSLLPSRVPIALAELKEKQQTKQHNCRAKEASVSHSSHVSHDIRVPWPSGTAQRLVGLADGLGAYTMGVAVVGLALVGAIWGCRAGVHRRASPGRLGQIN